MTNLQIEKKNTIHRNLVIKKHEWYIDIIAKLKILLELSGSHQFGVGSNQIVNLIVIHLLHAVSVYKNHSYKTQRWIFGKI